MNGLDALLKEAEAYDQTGEWGAPADTPVDTPVEPPATPAPTTKAAPPKTAPPRAARIAPKAAPTPAVEEPVKELPPATVEDKSAFEAAKEKEAEQRSMADARREKLREAVEARDKLLYGEDVEWHKERTARAFQKAKEYATPGRSYPLGSGEHRASTDEDWSTKLDPLRGTLDPFPIGPLGRTTKPLSPFVFEEGRPVGTRRTEARRLMGEAEELASQPHKLEGEGLIDREIRLEKAAKAEQDVAKMRSNLQTQVRPSRKVPIGEASEEQYRADVKRTLSRIAAIEAKMDDLGDRKAEITTLPKTGRPQGGWSEEHRETPYGAWAAASGRAHVLGTAPPSGGSPIGGLSFSGGTSGSIKQIDAQLEKLKQLRNQLGNIASSALYVGDIDKAIEVVTPDEADHAKIEQYLKNQGL